ncbi:DNA recombination protein RmuC [Jiella sp. MQZ9-1]|uniref:DNA recombination protein RmuC homolog n=1 Tax=Jiella flava TaxID=2816857 RepID=A0A939FZ84_9HYPH|nr:DNA recombination protein RmuC [Jiella flava]MBO0662728.1 DNA recombination protein RmuC [Jiella flava]MCD2471150.1 DNA recombination protein RmuC [Jiella flava]
MSHDLTTVLNRTLAVIGGVGISGLALVLAGLLLVFAALWWAARARARQAEEALAGAEAEAGRLDTVLRTQAEISGRMQTMAEILGSRQADLTRALSDRLDGLSSRVGQSILATTKETKASLSVLAERLAVIDRAQSEIRNLTGEVVRLKDILSNKQTRGAFGEGRMQAIVADALPASVYAFQATLSNGRRPDCLIRMPNGAPGLVIDAKFPLEAYSALEASTSDDAKAAAAVRMRRDMDVHVKAIAEKYLIPGETQDTAFLFVPSETIFAVLHEDFDDIVQKAYRTGVVIVSPSLLNLSIQVVQAVLKDARLRASAGRIQAEVRLFAEDLSRLDERVSALKGHFTQASRDIDQIAVSSAKLQRRGDRITGIEIGDNALADDAEVKTAHG